MYSEMNTVKKHVFWFTSHANKKEERILTAA